MIKDAVGLGFQPPVFLLLQIFQTVSWDWVENMCHVKVEGDQKYLLWAGVQNCIVSRCDFSKTTGATKEENMVEHTRWFYASGT